MRLRVTVSLHSDHFSDRLWRWRPNTYAPADVYNCSRHLHAHRERDFRRGNRVATSHAYCPLIIASGSGEEDKSSSPAASGFAHAYFIAQGIMVSSPTVGRRRGR
jgi:hypothetical protein